jgi:hypothetical protein
MTQSVHSGNSELGCSSGQPSRRGAENLLQGASIALGNHNPPIDGTFMPLNRLSLGAHPAYHVRDETYSDRMIRA